MIRSQMFWAFWIGRQMKQNIRGLCMAKKRGGGVFATFFVTRIDELAIGIVFYTHILMQSQ